MKIELTTQHKELNDEEQKGYDASISAVFPRLEEDIKLEMYERLVQGYTQAQQWDDVLKCQGEMEGMAVLLEKWRTAHNAHMERQQPAQEVDNTEIVGTIEDN